MDPYRFSLSITKRKQEMPIVLPEQHPVQVSHESVERVDGVLGLLLDLLLLLLASSPHLQIMYSQYKMTHMLKNFSTVLK